LFVLASCNSSTHENTENKENLIASDTTNKDREVIEPISIDTVLIGDLNSDRVLDTAFITTPAMIKHLDENDNLKFYGDCLNGDCYNRINFSNGLSEIYNDNSIWGSLENLGDLNGDGYSELIFSPSWFIGCRGPLYVYCYNGMNWNIAGRVDYYRCSDDILSTHVRKVKGKYFLYGTTNVNGDEVESRVELKMK
jgi:hypothetical protein